jgi:hypothetical protein
LRRGSLFCLILYYTVNEGFSLVFFAFFFNFFVEMGLSSRYGKKLKFKKFWFWACPCPRAVGRLIKSQRIVFPVSPSPDSCNHALVNGDGQGSLGAKGPHVWAAVMLHPLWALPGLYVCNTLCPPQISQIIFAPAHFFIFKPFFALFSGPCAVFSRYIILILVFT